jgi:hypothetical protein
VRDRLQPLWFTLFGVLVAVYGLAIWGSTQIPTNPAAHGAERASQKEEPKVSADERVASYTGWLALLTGLLVAVTSGQIGFLIRADKTARISADAAKTAADAARDAANSAKEQSLHLRASVVSAQKAADAADLSAKAAIGVELPSLHIVSVTSDVDPAVVTFPEYVRLLTPVVEYTNYGRTPAFIDEIIVNALIDGALPRTPIYRRHLPWSERIVIGHGEIKKTMNYAYVGSKAFSDDDIAGVTDGSRDVYVYGVISYRDFLDKSQSRGFLSIWVPDTREFIPLYLPEYHYQRAGEPPHIERGTFPESDWMSEDPPDDAA